MPVEPWAQPAGMLLLLLFVELPELLDVLVVSTEVLGQPFVVGRERQRVPPRRPRLGQDLRILNRDLILEVVHRGSAEPFDDVQVLAVEPAITNLGACVN